MLSKSLAAWAIAALALPFLHGCGNDEANQGEVRLVNATTEYTSLDLYRQDSNGNDSLVLSGTASGAASGYTGVDKGTRTFDIKSASGPSVAASAPGTITKGDHFAVITYVTGSKPQAQFIAEEETHPSSGNAKLRVFNAASSDVASVDVYLSANACDALTVTDTVFASAVAGLQSSYSQVTATSAGTSWNVCVFAAGDTSTLLLDIPALTLKDQEIATLVLTHTSGGVLLNAAVLDQQGAYTSYASSLARVRLAADARSGAAVSVTINGTAISQSVSPSLSDYVTLASGTLTADVTINGVTTTGVALPTIAAGSDYTLLVTGSGGSATATLISDNNTPSTSTSQTVKARVINGVNDLSGTLGATIDNKSVGSAGFAAASSYVTIPATTGTSTVQATITTNPASLINQSFASKGVYTVFVWGDAAAPKLAVNQDH